MEIFMALTSSQKNCLINVISPEGNVANITVKPNFTIEKVKTLAMKQLYGNDKTKVPSQFRLIHSSKFQKLVDGNNINDEQVKENDTLLLTKIRPACPKVPVTGRGMEGPNEEAILQATNDLPTSNLPRYIQPINCVMNNEMKQIVVSLARTSAKLLMYSSEAKKTYNILKEKLKRTCDPPVNEDILKCLMDFGYSHETSVQAILLSGATTQIEVMDWLIDSVPDFDADNDYSHLLRIGNLEEDGNIINIVEFLLKSFYLVKKLTINADTKALIVLMEMGFNGKDVVNALKMTGNNLVNACEWLLGDHSYSLRNLYEGCNPDSPVYEAIINNADIQISLKNPKMLLAFLSIIESTTSIWMLDIDVLPILEKIFTIYRNEKYAIYINKCAGE
nr:ubiquitin-associated domain-containing protein 1 isoform X2 [Megalopta genalis]